LNIHFLMCSILKLKLWNSQTMFCWKDKFYSRFDTRFWSQLSSIRTRPTRYSTPNAETIVVAGRNSY
jgi:hypothetical protein